VLPAAVGKHRVDLVVRPAVADEHEGARQRGEIRRDPRATYRGRRGRGQSERAAESGKLGGALVGSGRAPDGQGRDQESRERKHQPVMAHGAPRYPPRQGKLRRRTPAEVWEIRS
jgi:hypothetical protein